MATQMHPSSRTTSAVVVPTPAPQGHRRLRGLLAGLTAFMALTAISGALFVVPTMPASYLKYGPFSDFTIPALALGIVCGGIAAVACIAVLLRPMVGAAASFVAGMCMIGFELVEIAVVGPTFVQTPSEPVAWLQVVYILLGLALMAFGARLWKAETGNLWPF